MVSHQKDNLNRRFSSEKCNSSNTHFLLYLVLHLQNRCFELFFAVFVAKEINNFESEKQLMSKQQQLLEQLRTQINSVLCERVSMYTLQNASPEKRKAWQRVKTEELEKLYAAIQQAQKDIPKETFDAWDKKSFEIISKIIADRRVLEARDKIARMMELAGLHYGVEQNIWRKRQVQRERLGKKEQEGVADDTNHKRE